jgi:hypothetical protein
MSRYQIDRVLKDVGTFEPHLKRYLEDPAGYLDGMDLEPAEREALAACDTASLWTLGAHPFILLSFVRNIGIARGRPPAEVIRDYKAAIRPLGRPDYAS